MSICPYVKQITKNLFTKLSQEGTSLKKNFNIINDSQRKRLDMVAGRKDSEQKPLSTIPTVLTSWGSSCTKKHRALQTTTTKKKLWNKQKRNIMLYLLVIVMQETTSILQDKLKDQYTVTGFGKPCANIGNLINVVKNDTN